MLLHASSLKRTIGWLLPASFGWLTLLSEKLTPMGRRDPGSCLPWKNLEVGGSKHTKFGKSVWRVLSDGKPVPGQKKKT